MKNKGINEEKRGVFPGSGIGMKILVVYRKNNDKAATCYICFFRKNTYCMRVEILKCSHKVLKCLRSISIQNLPF